MGLAVMVELPLVVIDVQRAGPSTGMPTKNEQADLLQVMFGRNGDSPMPIVAPATPGECFDLAIEACRLALKYMTPVVFLSDAFLATGSEPWRVPSLATCPTSASTNATDPATFRPYQRDPETLARPWAVPGTPGLEHRIGGLEKADITGNVSYDPDNHHRMQTPARRPRWPASPTTSRRSRSSGRSEGDLLILGWGSTYGAIRSRRRAAAGRGPVRRPRPPAPPQPVPGEHRGRCSGATGGCSSRRSTWASCSMLIRAQLPGRRVGYNRVRGKPFRIAEIVERGRALLGGGTGS